MHIPHIVFGQIAEQTNSIFPIGFKRIDFPLRIGRNINVFTILGKTRLIRIIEYPVSQGDDLVAIQGCHPDPVSLCLTDKQIVIVIDSDIARIINHGFRQATVNKATATAFV